MLGSFRFEDLCDAKTPRSRRHRSKVGTGLLPAGEVLSYSGRKWLARTRSTLVRRQERLTPCSSPGRDSLANRCGGLTPAGSIGLGSDVTAVDWGKSATW